MSEIISKDVMKKLIHMEMTQLSEKDMDFVNPMLKWGRKELENPLLSTLRLLRNPDYVYFTCKYVLNLRLLPYQQVILQEMWKSTFPMLVASRGAGKCTNGETWVISEDGFRRIGELVNPNIAPHTPDFQNSLSLLGEQGFNPVEYVWNNGRTATKQITTRRGYRIEVTQNHPLRVVKDGNIEWVNGEDICTGDSVPIDRSLTWFPNTNNLSPNLAYAFGLLIGDGGMTVPGRIGFTTADECLMSALSSAFENYFGKGFRKVKSRYQYYLHSHQIYNRLYDDFGFQGKRCETKDFPKCVLSSTRESMAAFIRGLMDTDGHASKRRLQVEFCNKSENLVRTLQFILTRFGIIARLYKRKNKKYNLDYYYLTIAGNDARLFSDMIGFGLTRKQSILDSHLVENKVYNTNLDVIPHSLIKGDLFALAEEWKKIRPSEGHSYSYNRGLLSPSRLMSYQMSYDVLGYILELTQCLSILPEWRRLKEIYDTRYFYDTVVSTEDSQCVTYDVHMKCDDDRSFFSGGFISHNSFLLAVYAILRALWIQGRQVVITGSGFRQSKTIMNYIETVYNNSPVLKSLVSENSQSGPHHDADRWTMRLGDSLITALPLGDGQKIRGQRAHDIIADEFASIPREIFETVVAGFGVVELEPYEKVERAAEIRVLKKHNLWSSEMEEASRASRMGNQTVISGTAYYQFNHFAEYWKKWHGIIMSKGDKDKLALIVGKVAAEEIDWRDYSIIRLPVDLLPQGYMDERHVARSRATVHTGIFLNEFGAVFSSDTNGFSSGVWWKNVSPTSP